jgi:hypothetical protein
MNGNKIGEAPQQGDTDTSYYETGNAPTAMIGARWNSGSAKENLIGSVDEIQIHNTSRNASWINLSYQNQKEPSSFYNHGGIKSQFRC